MKLEFINNAGITNLESEFEKQVKVCRSFDIASAFVTQETIHILRLFLKSNKNRNRVGRLITGIYHCFNSKEVLHELNHLANSSKGKLIVKISKTPNFHWKYYDFQNSTNNCLYIGSANFTNSGLTSIGEFQTKITISKKDSNTIKHANILYDKEWENSIDISQFPISKYKESNHIIFEKLKLDPEIKALFFKPERKIHSLKNIQPKRIVKISGLLLKSTIKQIEASQSHWEKNDWDYFSLLTKKEFNQYAYNDILLLISKISNEYQFEIIKVEDKCQLNTNEGNYFIAYTTLGKSFKETEKIKSELFDSNINYRSRSNIDKKITKIQLQAINSLFIEKLKIRK